MTWHICVAQNKVNKIELLGLTIEGTFSSNNQPRLGLGGQQEVSSSAYVMLILLLLIDTCSPVVLLTTKPKPPPVSKVHITP